MKKLVEQVKEEGGGDEEKELDDHPTSRPIASARRVNAVPITSTQSYFIK